MTLLLQESGGERWVAPVQSPMPIRRLRKLKRSQRLVLLGVVVLFGVTQLLGAFAPRSRTPAPITIPVAP